MFCCFSLWFHKKILFIYNITQVAAAFCLVCKCCRVSVHMVLLFIDHEASVHSAPPNCLFSLSVWLETLQKWWPAAGEGCLSFEVCPPLIDLQHILKKKIKGGIKGIAKLFKTLCAPKKKHQKQGKQAKQVVAAGQCNQMSNIRHAADRQQKLLMPDSSKAPSLTGTCLTQRTGTQLGETNGYKVPTTLLELLLQHKNVNLG